MQFLCSTMQWAWITRHGRLWQAAAAKYQLQYNKYWSAMGQINEHTKQDKSKTNKNFIINWKFGSKINQEVEYFIAGLDNEADMVTYENITQNVHIKYNDVFTGVGCFTGTVF